MQEQHKESFKPEIIWIIWVTFSIIAFYSIKYALNYLQKDERATTKPVLGSLRNIT